MMTWTALKCSVGNIGKLIEQITTTGLHINSVGTLSNEVVREQ